MLKKKSSDSYRFGHLDFGHLDLSFDLAQDGEPVEPFRISNFVLRIYTDIFWHSPLTVTLSRGQEFLRWTEHRKLASTTKVLLTWRGGCPVSLLYEPKENRLSR